MIEIDGLSRCQNTCPKCSNSYVSVYNMLDDNLDSRMVVGFCPKCNKEWIIASEVKRFVPIVEGE